MFKSEYHITKMDCPSEENMIRMKLDGIQAINNWSLILKTATLPFFTPKKMRKFCRAWNH